MDCSWWLPNRSRGEGVDFKEHGVAFVVFKRIGPTETPFVEVAFSHTHTRSSSNTKGSLVSMLMTPLNAPGPAAAELAPATPPTVQIESGAPRKFPSEKFNLDLVHPVDELQRTHRRGAVELMGVDDFEVKDAESKRPFVAKPFEKLPVGASLIAKASIVSTVNGAASVCR